MFVTYVYCIVLQKVLEYLQHYCIGVEVVARIFLLYMVKHSQRSHFYHTDNSVSDKSEYFFVKWTSSFGSLLLNLLNIRCSCC